jgi:hypothetical protein
VEGVHEDGADPDLLGDLHAACDGVAEHAASAIGALGRGPMMLMILKNVVAVAITYLTGNAAYSIRAYSPMRRVCASLLTSCWSGGWTDSCAMRRLVVKSGS